jgi:hypothetical protein
MEGGEGIGCREEGRRQQRRRRVRAGREGKAAVATWERREVGEGRGFIYIGFERVVANFFIQIFKFIQLF